MLVLKTISFIFFFLDVTLVELSGKYLNFSSSLILCLILSQWKIYSCGSIRERLTSHTSRVPIKQCILVVEWEHSIAKSRRMHPEIMSLTRDVRKRHGSKLLDEEQLSSERAEQYRGLIIVHSYGKRGSKYIHIFISYIFCMQIMWLIKSKPI